MRGALLVLILWSCRSIDPDLDERTKRELFRMKNVPARVEPVSSAPLPARWAPGQFAVWAIAEKNFTSLLSLQVQDVSFEGAVTVKLVQLSPKLRTTAELKFSHQPNDLADARAALTQIIRVRGDARPFSYVFKKDAPDEMRDAVEPLWSALIPAVIPGPSETVQTPAARLEGCRSAQTDLPYQASGLHVKGWVHPAVPITGFVRGKANDGSITVELVEYGWSGGAPNL